MGQVRTTFTSEDKDVQKALDQMTKSLQKYVEENRRLKEESKQTRESQKGLWAEAERGAERMHSLMDGLLQVQGAYNSMLEQTRRLQELAANAARGTAGSQREFLTNLGNIPRAEMEREVARIEAAAKRTGIPVGTLYSAAGMATAAKGNLSVAQSVSHVEQATGLTRDSAQLPEVAMGLLNVSNLLGTSDPKTAAGFLLAMGEQAPVPSMRQIASNLVPAAKSVAARGGTAAEAAALVNTIASSMQDPEGRMAGTAGIALSDQLFEQVPGQTSPLARLQFLQQNPGAAKAFIQKSSFEKKAQATIEALLDPNSTQSQILRENVAKFPGINTLAGSFDQFVGKVDSFGLQQFAVTEGKLQQAIERARLSNEEGAQTATIRQFLSDALDESGAWDFPVLGRKGWLMKGFESRVAGGVNNLFRGRESPEEAAIAVLEARKAQLGVGPETDAKLDEMIEELRAIRGNQRAVNPEAHRE